MATESELMRVCAPLYPSFALESLWTLILAAFFAYLSVLISAKQQLRNPGRAVCRFVCHHIGDWVSDTYRVLSRWDTMHMCDLGQRFRLTRRLNATICRIQVVAAVLSVTRWLHFNNVNGFRYLGYSFTCPLMQAELILLIAPAVPCYKANIIFIMAITWVVMIFGWYASSLEGDLWTTDMQDVFLEGNFENLTSKGMAVFPSMACVLFLSLVQMPYMLFLYNFRGKREDMPEGFNTMILLTAVSWLGFPVWWFLSYEGASVLSGTKLNGLGFMLLNIVAKGGFTLKMISMVKDFKRRQAAQKPRERSASVASLCTLPELPGDEELAVQRKQRALPTSQSLVWMIQAMKPFDNDESEGASGALAGGAARRAPARPGADELTNEELMAELLRRMGMDAIDIGGDAGYRDGAVSPASCLSGEALFERSLKDACLLFADEEDSEAD